MLVCSMNNTLIETQRLHEKLPEELYREIFNVSPACIAIATADDERFLEANDGFLELLGYERDTLIGRTLAELDVTLQLAEDEKQTSIPKKLNRNEALLWKNARITTRAGEVRDVIGSFLDFTVAGEDYVLYKLVDITSRRQLEREVLQASDREQRRIGEGLHDSLGGSLTRLSALAQILPLTLEEENREKTKDLAHKLHKTAKRAAEDARRTVYGLLPGVLTREGLVPALRELARQTEETPGIRCALHCAEGAEALADDSGRALHLYRIAQEAVHNAVKHSGGTAIDITLERADDAALRLTVRDDGGGFPPSDEDASQGAGLRSMRYRARLIGATLHVQSDAEGTTVVCSLPSGPAAEA